MSDLHQRRDLAIGRPAPEIEGTDFDGRPFLLIRLPGPGRHPRLRKPLLLRELPCPPTLRCVP